MIEIVNGRIFFEGKETNDPTLIGYALLDFAESTQGDALSIILNNEDVFIKKLVCV